MIESIRLTDLPSWRIALPDLDEQRAIAHILGTLDDKIELNRRTNETLEAIARALFKSWFVDFDPVRAKSEGRDPGLPPHLADLFPDSFEDSELGEIPRGWRVTAVANLADVNLRTLDRTDRLDVIDYVEISEVTRGQVANVARYERGTEPSRARRRLAHGDTVISTVRPDRGSYFLSLSPPETLIVSTGFAVASPRDGNWAFLYSALTRPEVGDALGRLADGGAYPAVRPEEVAGLRLASPQVGEARTAYDAVAGPLYERAEHRRAENRALAALRDTLLPRLISGQLRVAESVDTSGWDLT
jgi:type I restriction enzyme S subunit